MLFGYDLRTLWRDWLAAMESLHGYPPLSWFEVAPVVRLRLPDGRDVRWHQGQVQPAAVSLAKDASGESFALLLPDELVLTKQLHLPLLPAEQVAEAVWLDIHSSSPFASGDIAWGYQSRPHADGGLEVALAFASRAQIAVRLEAQSPSGWPVQHTEVWASGAFGLEQPVVLQGYAEARRSQRVRQMRRRTWLSLLVLGVLLACLLVTPVLQLQWKAHQAEAAYQSLWRETQTLSAQRDAFAKTLEELEVVKTGMAGSVNVLEALKTLTEQLPADAHLRLFQWENNTIQISAYADNAAAVLQTLGQTGLFEEVRFSRAVTRQPYMNKDDFSAQLVLKPGSFAIPMNIPNPPPVPETPEAAPPTPDAVPATGEPQP